jgi:solute carrier family 25 2-oxodicarboxylate transporter 21
MQLERGKTSTSLLGSFRTIIREEGFGRLYRGLVPPLLLEAPKRATKFAANDFWGKTFKDLTGQPEMTRQLSIITGCSAGATESFVVVPFELVKIKLQDKSLASTYSGPLDVVRQIVRKGGILGLYAGMEATFWRHLWWNGGYFGSIFQVKTMLPKAETPQGQLLNNFVSGSVGGFVGTVLNTPFDVVKSRIQGAEKLPGVIPKYNWTYPALITIFREEGPAALYKGFVPKVLRLAPGGGVLLLVVEFTLGVFRKALGPPYI